MKRQETNLNRGEKDQEREIPLESYYFSYSSDGFHNYNNGKSSSCNVETFTGIFYNLQNLLEKTSKIQYKISGIHNLHLLLSLFHRSLTFD